MKRESDLYRPVKRLLQAQGYAVKGEVGKADLVAAVIERQLELVLAAQQPELDHTDSWQGIDAWMARIVREQSRRGGPFGCPLGTIAAELKNDDTFGPSLDAAFARWEAPPPLICN